MKRKMSLFTKVYISVVACFMVLLVAVSGFLWSVLSAYENTRPKHTAQEVFEEYFLSKDTDALLSIGTMGNNFESQQIKEQVLREQLNNKQLQYFSVSKDETSQKYAVTADGVRVAYFTLSKKEHKNLFGFYGFSLEFIELFAPNNINKKILVPEGYVLTINSMAVDEQYITNKKIAHHTNEYLPSGEEGLYLNEYTVSGFCNEPDIKVTTPDGNAVELTENRETKVLSAQVLNDEQLQNKFSQYAIKVATIYTEVMSKDAEKGELYQYVDKSSAFYKKLRTVDTWFWPHDGYKIRNTQASQFICHSEDVFSCRVTLVQELYTKKNTEIINVDLVLCFRNVNGKNLLYNAVTNG